MKVLTLEQAAADARAVAESGATLDVSSWLGTPATLPYGSVVVVIGYSNTGKSFYALHVHECLQVPGLYVGLDDLAHVTGSRAASLSPRTRRDTVVATPRPPRFDALARLLDTEVPQRHTRLVTIDYVQKVVGYRDGDYTPPSRPAELGAVMSHLKTAGERHGFVSLVLSQAKRPDTFSAKGGKLPRLTMFSSRDASDIENDADVVLCLYPEGRDVLSVTVEKCKDGRVGEVRYFERDPVCGALSEFPESELQWE